MKKAQFLVVDSGGFIKNAPLREIAETVVTLHEVVDEIRDKDTRQRLQVLPYELEFRQPTSEGIRKVSEFAKKTGDYASLSVTDLSVLAVTYDLEAEKVGVDHLRREPVVKKTTNFYKPDTNQTKINKSDAKISGFYNGDMEEEDEHVMEMNEHQSTLIEDKNEDTSVKESYDTFSYWREPIAEIEDLNLLESLENENLLDDYQMVALDKYLLSRSFLCGHHITRVDFSIFNHVNSSLDVNLHPNVYRWCSNVKSYPKLLSEDIDVDKVIEYIIANKDIVENDVVNSEESSEETLEPSEEEDIGYNSDTENNEDDNEDDGWITPSNLVKKKKAFTGDVQPVEDNEVTVACMTTDFAMQNVLKQLGLNILGTDGMVIRETKTWILRCYGCFTTTPAMEKKFCPKCGNKTLKRVSVTVNSDGSQQIHISTRKPLSAKGKKYSLPAPKGGKHAVNPKLTADQREPQQRVSKKAMARNNPMGEDYLAGNSPFVSKDVTSKSAMLGLHGAGKGNAKVPGMYWDRKNPNAVRKNTGNKKKKAVV